MDNKAFVFTGFAFLMVIPAIILAASLFNMMYYGSTGIAISMVSDEVFYGCQNLMSFLQDASRDGQREYAMTQAALYASEHGLNYTNVTINATFFKILLETPGFACNKTVELRFGTLRVNLTLYGWNTTVDGLPVYFRRVRNNIINTSTYVTFPNSSAVNGANVTLDILNESFKNTTDATGYYWQTLNITKYVDTTDACTRKTYLGQHSADATASLTNYYDGSDSESFRILGDMSSSTAAGYKPTKSTLGVKTTLFDEYGDPVTEYFLKNPDTPNCDSSYTSAMPSITVKIYETSIAPSNLKATYVSGSNISEDEPPVDSGIYKTGNGTTGISFTVSEPYYAVINATSSDYLSFNWQDVISFTDFEASNVRYGLANVQPNCDSGLSGNNYGIKLNITNVGTTDDTVWKNYTVVYRNSTGILDTQNYTYYPGGAKRGSNPWIVCSKEINGLTGQTIFANITSVGRPNLDVDFTNNLVNGTA